MMSKAEKQAALLEQQRHREAQEAVDYFPLLMKTLERATTEVGLPLVVRNGKFCLDVPRVWNDEPKTHELAVEYSREAQFELDDCEAQLGYVLAERREAARKEQVKRKALAKLSDEERTLLGL